MSLEVREGHALFEFTLLRLQSLEKVDFDHFANNLVALTEEWIYRGPPSPVLDAGPLSQYILDMSSELTSGGQLKYDFENSWC